MFKIYSDFHISTDIETMIAYNPDTLDLEFYLKNHLDFTEVSYF